jgi:hypothetical protein
VLIASSLRWADADLTALTERERKWLSAWRTQRRSPSRTDNVAGAVVAWDSCFYHRRIVMLYTLVVVLLVLWLLGLVTSYTLGGLIHALLVIAVVVLVLQLVSGRRGPPAV